MKIRHSWTLGCPVCDAKVLPSSFGVTDENHVVLIGYCQNCKVTTVLDSRTILQTVAEYIQQNRLQVPTGLAN